MLETKSKLSAVTQNVIIGCIAGLIIGYNLKYIFNTIGASDLLWIMFFILGPLIGYLSGRERVRFEKLKREKELLQKDFEGLQKKLQKSSQKYKLLIEKADDAIFLTSYNGNFLLFNSAVSSLTGYSTGQLRKMSISDLGISKEFSIIPAEYKFNNNSYIYDTVWKKKDGSTIQLNINAKKIPYKNYIVVLHVGRVIKKETETSDKSFTEHIKLIHRQNLDDMLSLFSSFYNQIIQPMNTTTKFIDYLNKNYPDEKDKCDSLFKTWDKSKNIMETMLNKRVRDSNTIPTNWNLNEIIYQELNFLKSTMDTDSFVVEASMDKSLPPVYGIGKNFSLLLGCIFKATVKSLKETTDKFFVSTRSINNINILEIKLSDNNNFEQQLTEIIYPSVKGGDSKRNSNTEIALQVINMYLETLNVEYNIGQENDITVIRIKFPLTEKTEKKDSEEFTKLYDDDDFLL